MTALKPFILIACVAFVAGFMSYVALSRIVAPDLAVAEAPAQDSFSSTASVPAPSDDGWNVGKKI